MNKDNAARFLPIVKALAEGKQLEHRVNYNSEWKPVYEVDTSGDPSNYRISPKVVKSYPVGMALDYYPVRFYCANCNKHDCVYLPKGVLKEGQSTTCENCGCAVEL